MSWELFIYTTLGAREAATVEGDLEAALESFFEEHPENDDDRPANFGPGRDQAFEHLTAGGKIHDPCLVAALEQTRKELGVNLKLKVTLHSARSASIS